MRVAMIGTRGVPARYGGFETAIEEIGRRLVGRGHEVVVYCRGAEDPSQRTHLGMELVHLPAARRKTLETLSHTALSVAHLVGTGGRRRHRLQRRQRAVRAGAACSRHPGRRPRRRTGVEAREVEGRRSPLLPGGRGHVGAARRRTDRRRQRHRRLLRRRVRRRRPSCSPTAHRSRTSPGSARVEELGLRPHAVPPGRGPLRAREPRAARSWRATTGPMPSCRSSSSVRRRTPTSTPPRIETRGRGRPADPAARRRLGPGAARPALRQRPHLPARPLGRRHEPVVAAGHGRRGTACSPSTWSSTARCSGIEGEYFRTIDDVSELVRKAELNAGDMLLGAWRCGSALVDVIAGTTSPPDTRSCSNA